MKAPLAGPLLIAFAVLVVLHDFVFGGSVTFTQEDVAAYWLPTYCHLGSSLAGGHVPAWNPYSLAGAPFAADPQSGWMYAPVMVLFTLFSCDLAIRLYIALLPILAGLGIYWFSRGEEVGRVPSTVAGLAVALAVAGSRMAVNLPFSATIAWTAILLATAARYMRASSWPARVGWLMAVALAWGQLAASHLSHGFVIGTGILAAYVLANSVSDVRRGDRPVREALTVAVVLVPALLLVNLAYFLPRLAYLPRTTLGEGYAGLQDLAARLAGVAETPFRIGPAAGPRWPFLFSISPGPYLGAATLALSLAGWWSRRHRPVVLAFGMFGLACYALSLGVVARFVEPVARALPFGDFYLYSPFRLRYALFVVIPVMAGFGLAAWLDEQSARRRVWLLAPGIILWWFLPLLAGVRPQRLWLLAIGAVATGGILVAASRRPRLALALPVLVALELAASGLIGQASSHEFYVTGIGQARGFRPLTPLLEPTVDAGAYVRPDALATAIRSGDGGRYLSLNPIRGYLGYQEPPDWPFLTNQRSLLFEIEEAQGYNPVQPIRYWSFIKAVNPSPELHNVSILATPSPGTLDLLAVEWLVVARESGSPERGATAVRTEGAWTLWRRADPPPRASVVASWTVVAGREAAIRALAVAGFDPRAEAIVEEEFAPTEPGRSTVPGPAGEAAFRWLGPQAARLDVDAGTAAILVIRNSFDPNWHATLDGEPADVVPVDGFLQGVVVPAGRHTVVLTYDDPWIGYGVLGSTVVLISLAGGAISLRRLSRKRSQPSTATSADQLTPETTRP